MRGSIGKKGNGLVIGTGHGTTHAAQGLGTLDALLRTGFQIIGIALDILQDTGLLVFLLEPPQGSLQGFIFSDGHFDH